MDHVRPKMKQLYESEYRVMVDRLALLDVLAEKVEEGKTVEIFRVDKNVAIEVRGGLKGLGKTVEEALEDMRRRG